MVSLVWAIVYQLATGIAGLALVAMILLASKCPLGSVEWGFGVEARAMSDIEVHVKAAREKRLAALDEFDRKRFTVVEDLAIKEVEHAIEALVALDGVHFFVCVRGAS